MSIYRKSDSFEDLLREWNIVIVHGLIPRPAKDVR